MDKKFIVFDSLLEDYSHQLLIKRKLTEEGWEQQAEIAINIMLARFFEELLLFDKVSLKIGPQNLPFQLLISQLGINAVERLIDEEVFELVLWTPKPSVEVGRVDESGNLEDALGRSPIQVNSHNDDAEKNLFMLLKPFDFHPDRKKIFTKKALKHFVVMDKKFVNEGTQLILDTYLYGNLGIFGLKPAKVPEDLSYDERCQLFDLSDEILNTAFLAQKQYKSYDAHIASDLTIGTVKRIEDAFKVSQDVSAIMQIEGVADLQQLFRDNILDFDKVYELRDHAATRHYRKWINTVSNDPNARQVSVEYIDAITQSNSFFRSNIGKFIKTTGMFGVGIGVGATLGSIEAGVVAGKAAEYGLGLLDTYVLDGLLSGWDPRLFIQEIKEAAK